MHFLVTGGCGFIGSHLAHTLVAEGYTVRILDNLSSGDRSNAPSSAELMVADIIDNEAVQAASQGVDGIFHLAAVASVPQCNAEWFASHRTNAAGTVAVFEAAAKSKSGAIPVVYASSAAVYGDNPVLPLSESEAAAPLTFYGQDKLSNEQYARIGAHIHGLSSLGLRFFNVYGPGQNPASPYSGVISRFIDAAKQGSAVTLFGDGEQTRDFIFVRDIVSLLMLSMQHLRQQASSNIHTVLNGATGVATSLLGLLSVLEGIVGRPIGTQHAAARAGDIRHSRGNPAMAQQLLGFSASTPLSEGLRDTFTLSSVGDVYG